MKEELLTFQKFKDEEIAKDLCEKLSAAGIYFETETEDKFFDPSFSVNPVKNNISIKLRSADFNNAHKVLDEYYREQASLVEKDYYLFAFTDGELKEVIAKKDEWGHLDYQLAQIILAGRGIALNQSELEYLNEQRKQELSKPEKSQHWLVLTGYFIAAASPFWTDLVRYAGFFLAVMIGWILQTAKKTLPNGDAVFTYSASDRRQGKFLIIFSIVIFLAVIIYNTIRG